MKKILTSFVVALAGIFIFASPSFAETVYNALPSVSPETSYPSQPFQAQQTAEFGDSIHLGGTDRILDKITVTMVTWARFSEYSTNPLYMENNTSWRHPITLNVYGTSLDTNGVPDNLLATVTQSITIPWRPASDPTCPNTGYGEGFAWRNDSGNCLNGLAFNAVFDLNALIATLPDDVIVSVAYNTQTWGYNPVGVAGPYNSLNVAVPPNQPVSVGSDDNINAVFWNTETAGYYADGGIGGVGTFREDTNWTPYGTVAIKVEAQSPAIEPPNDKSQCKNDGWMSFNNPFFKNQGDCVSWIQSSYRAIGNKTK